ncbi:MAG: GNAT family N-acetyltransferase [Alphaproteobacteria bacterium]|nr:GNAT family N-acetyltransferase [Alphaproteobacteria bacterium]
MVWQALKFSSLKKPSFPAIELSAERIYMRPPMIEDAKSWAEVRGRNISHIQPFDPKWPDDALTPDLFLRRISRQFYEWQHDRARAFLIFDTHTHALIGGMNINNICRGAAQYASLGFWIDEDCQGQGLMREALALTLKYCFEDLKLHRVHASCLPHNERSKKTLHAAGFKKEGFAEKYLQINGLWEDHVLFGLPKENWVQQNS